MSMLFCDSCHFPVDSDDDPECFNTKGHLGYKIMCERCREEKKREDEFIDW